LPVAGLVASATGFAATPDVDAPSVKVRYDDLNLATSAGVNVLYRRISAAARQVCPDIYSRDPHVALAAQHCQAAAVAKAVTEVNSPSLAMPAPQLAFPAVDGGVGGAPASLGAGDRPGQLTEPGRRSCLGPTRI